MGLNAIEIIMALEDEFRIDLPDKELADVRTVGDLYEVVMAKLGRPVGDGVCMTSRVFYRLRRGLQEVTGLRRRDITPATPLAEALPAWARRRRWGTWSESAGVALPQLQLPRPLAIAVGLATLLICLGLAWSLYQADIAWYVAWPLVVVWWLPVVLVVAAVQKLASPLAVLFPTGVRTVGDLAHAVVRRGVPPHHHATGDRSLLTPETVWNRLADVIEHEAAVERELITAEAIFGDLGT